MSISFWKGCLAGVGMTVVLLAATVFRQDQWYQSSESRSLLAASSSSSAASNGHLLRSSSSSKKRFYEKPTRTFERTKFTLDEFVVNGVNLATYGFEKEQDEVEIELTEPYQLYDTFDISPMMDGSEGWWDLIRYHGEYLKRKELLFYVDKIAWKRYMVAKGIPSSKSHVLLYQRELLQEKHIDNTGKKVEEDYVDPQEHKAILDLLPRTTNFVAKPAHVSCSQGVWIVRYNEKTGKNDAGYGRTRKLDSTTGVELDRIAKKLAEYLYEKAPSNNWAYRQIQPGIVVEDRFSAPDGDDLPAMEFKIFTIWGRVWMAYWKRGNQRPGLVYRNGTVMNNWSEFKPENANLPDWVPWDRVVQVAEQLGQHKDLFRVDVFVGIPAGDAALKPGVPPHIQQKAVLVVVNEVDYYPKCHFDEEIHDEGLRLWMAGYKMGIYDPVPNQEVPQAFVDKKYLSQEDAARLQLGGT